MQERSVDVLVVGAGPAGSAAAAWAARAGHQTLLVDAATFPRDKTCGDGLTPRAYAQLVELGLSEWLQDLPRNLGVRMIGFGAEHELPWNGPAFPTVGSAAPRTVLDDTIRRVAVHDGAEFVGGARAGDVQFATNGAVASVAIAGIGTVRCGTLIVADGVRSQLGRALGRTWHRETVHGVAARAYIESGLAEDPWITSHLELRDAEGAAVPGYGWMFPLGNGRMNIGVGSLSTKRHAASVNLHALLRLYASTQREQWQLRGEPEQMASAMLPMGGAVSQVAGRNWMLIGDAAACVNPLNGEGIDYGLETGRFAAELIGSTDLERAWPALLRREYGDTFSIARRLAALLTVPWFLPAFGPIGMRSRAIMGVALRVMGNLVTDADRDTVARMWRASGSLSQRIDARPPWT